MGTRLRELMKASRDLEDKASSNQASALELLRMGEQLQQTVENMKTVGATGVHFIRPLLLPVVLPWVCLAVVWVSVRPCVSVRVCAQVEISVRV